MARRGSLRSVEVTVRWRRNRPETRDEDLESVVRSCRPESAESASRVRRSLTPLRRSFVPNSVRNPSAATP